MFEEEVLAGEPTAESAAAVLAADPTEMSRSEALTLLSAAVRLARAAEAVQVAAIRAAAGDEPAPDPFQQSDEDGAPLDEAAEEVALVLGGSRAFGLRRVEVARFLGRFLPVTRAAMRAGRYGWYEAGLVTAAAEALSDPSLAGGLEQRIVPKGSHDLARRLRRAAARLDPEGVRQQAERRRVGGGAWRGGKIFGSGDSKLEALGPSHLMALLTAAIDAEAKAKLPGDDRTIEMRRFDVVVDWARERLGLHDPDDAPPVDHEDQPPDDQGQAGTAGRPAPASSAAGAAASQVPDPAAACGGAPGAAAEKPSRRCGSCGRTSASRVPIQVTVPLDTLLGLSDAPGELAGWGVLDADACRELAADGAWRRWITDPMSGALLDVGAREYVPGAALARFVRGRDRTCRWPGCNQPSSRCDLDHRVAFDHDAAKEGRPQPGPTVRANLGSLCRRHHRIKTLGQWTLTRDAEQLSRWISPSGRSYEQPAEAVFDVDPQPPAAAGARAPRPLHHGPEPDGMAPLAAGGPPGPLTAGGPSGGEAS